MMGLNKKYLRSGKVCRVTFGLPKEAVNGAESVNLVGDFNHWDYYSNPMKRRKNGDFSISLDLCPGTEYRFKYLIDKSRWENDWQADKYIQNEFGSEDSVVVV